MTRISRDVFASHNFSLFDNEAILTFHKDGTMTVGEKWKDSPNEAARAIVEALPGAMRNVQLEAITRALTKLANEADISGDYTLYKRLLDRAARPEELLS